MDLMLRAATVQLSLASLRSGLAAAEAIGGVDEAVVSAATVVMQQLVRLYRSLCHSVYTYLYVRTGHRAIGDLRRLKKTNFFKDLSYIKF